MPDSFLGKTAASSPRPAPARKGISLALVAVIILGPLALAATVLGLLFSDFSDSGVRVSPVSAEDSGFRILADTLPAAGTTTATTAATQNPGSAASAATRCTFSINQGDAGYVNPATIFPIIPPALQAGGSCPSTYWNMDVLRFFIYKALTLVNWLAAALAILLTIVAGLYYMAGFANEANVKKGKTILTAAYVGLVIVVMARAVIYGSIQVFSGQSTYNPDTTNTIDSNYTK